MKRIRIEYRVRETRPSQRPTWLTKRVQGQLFEDDLAEVLRQILDDAAAAYKKDRGTLSLRWRRLGLRGSGWATFP